MGEIRDDALRITKNFMSNTTPTLISVILVVGVVSLVIAGIYIMVSNKPDHTEQMSNILSALVGVGLACVFTSIVGFIVNSLIN